jgi:hypothetical protein
VAAADADAIAQAATEMLEAIRTLQTEQMQGVQALVTKLMPNDFRTGMMMAYQRRSEARAAAGPPYRLPAGCLHAHAECVYVCTLAQSQTVPYPRLTQIDGPHDRAEAMGRVGPVYSRKVRLAMGHATKAVRRPSMHSHIT